MDMPAAVQAYFDADLGADAEALVGAFATDAVVRDEGETRAGHDAIRSWWLAAKRAYDHVAEPLEAAGDGDFVRVRARVTGNFPGSPAVLAYRFQVAEGRIVGLEIG